MVEQGGLLRVFEYIENREGDLCMVCLNFPHPKKFVKIAE